jgi:cytochrome c oxidase subunit 2
MRTRPISAAALLVLAAAPACTGPQSALAPAGRAAARIADLFWWMTAGSAVIFVGFIGLAIYALYKRHPGDERRAGRLLIIGGGVVFPTVVLAGLLAYGLAMLPPLVAPAPEGSLRVAVTGEQYWWRVRYLPAGDGAPIELANELVLPAGEPVQLILESSDVIHSFWVPSLAGKMDMIPGRTTRLVLEPTAPGVYRGACAELCGTSHAHMGFFVRVVERAAFDGWLAAQAAPAQPPAGDEATRGARLFLASGCGACHTVRGTRADGVIGPDLTHVGGRLSVGAGLLPPTRDGLAAFIARSETLKPAVHMPEFGMLAEADLAALAAYLEGLR